MRRPAKPVLHLLESDQLAQGFACTRFYKNIELLVKVSIYEIYVPRLTCGHEL